MERKEEAATTLKGDGARPMSSGLSWLYLGAVAMQGPFLLGALWLAVLKRPVPFWAEPALMLISYGVFIICASFYLAKTRKQPGAVTPGVLLRSAVSGGAAVLLMLVTMLCFGLLYRQAIPFLPLMNGEGGPAVGFVAGAAAVALVLLIGMTAAVALMVTLMERGMALGSAGRVWRLLLKAMLVRPHRAVGYAAVSGLMLYAMNAALNLAEEGLASWLGESFMGAFLLRAGGSFAVAFYLWLLIRFSRRLALPIEEPLERLETEASKPGIPIYAVVLLGLTCLLTVFLAPLGTNGADQVTGEVRMHLAKGDAALGLGLTRRAIYEYDRGYSKLLALRGYLQGLKTLEEPNEVAAGRSAADFSLSGALDANNGYLAYFNGELQLLRKDYDGALRYYRGALSRRDSVPEAWVGILEAGRGKNDPAVIREAAQVMAAQELHRASLAGLRRLSTGALEKEIEALNALEGTLGPKQVYKAVEKARSQDPAGALNDLEALRKLWPRDPVIAYHTAQLYNEYKLEQGNYPNVQKMVREFDTLAEAAGLPEEEGRKLFVAQLLVDSADLAGAETVLKEALRKSPESRDLALRLAYVLLENTKAAEAAGVLEERLKAEPKDLEALALLAKCRVAEGMPTEAVTVMSDFLQAAKGADESKPLADRELYSFSLAYVKGLEEGAFQEGIADSAAIPMLREYLLAVRGWRLHDGPESSKHIEKVLAEAPDLGYAWYILGVNAYEDTVRTGGSDFSKAEAAYLKSLRILPSHAEGYFALAHCYKKWGRNVEALRAFRKVVDLMPYEDHRTDPYGMTVHALGEVSSLASYDQKEVGQ